MFLRHCLSPPDRREIFLIILCITTFTISYNLESSFQFFHTVPSFFSSSSPSHIGNDGRKLSGWRDSLEGVIFGEWPWERGHLAMHVDEWRGEGGDDYQAIWTGKSTISDMTEFGDGTVDESFVRWGEDVPRSRILRHVPGHTVLENVILFNGTIYVVTNPHSPKLPSISSITSVTGPGKNEWEYISPQNARNVIGEYGGIIRGTTFISNDLTPSNMTLFSLWRAHASTRHDHHSPPPRRLIFPNLLAFSDPDPHENPPNSKYLERRVRSDTGFHPYTLKAAFPTLSVMYRKDWDDWHGVGTAFVFERIVVVDRVASGSGSESLSAAFEEGDRGWLDPIRRNLLSFFDVQLPKKRKRPVITYLPSPRIDHTRLLTSLQYMRKQYGYTVQIPSSDSWEQRLRAILESDVVLGVAGGEMVDAFYMPPGGVLMEFFPPAKYESDREVVARSLGMGYIAWWGERKLTSTPETYERPTGKEEVPLDAGAVVNAIREALSR